MVKKGDFMGGRKTCMLFNVKYSFYNNNFF